MTTSARPDPRFYELTASSESDFERRLAGIGENSRVLVLGCSERCRAHTLAARDLDVLGIDPRHPMVEAARRTASEEGLTTATFDVMSHDQFDLEDASFDVIVAEGILHRIDVALAFSEMARVLRPGGEVLLLEPLGHNPIINAYRRRTPGDRTRFEHPIRREDIFFATRWFESVDVQTHHLVSLAAGGRGNSAVLRSILERADRILLADRSPLRWQGWIAVVRLANPR